MIRENNAKLLLYKEESYLIQGGAFEIYKNFRNRHKESVYLRAFVEYLKNKGLLIDKERQIPIYFENKKVGVYVPDIVVNNCILVELKCKSQINRDDINQFWYYLKSSDFKVGYLINFGKSNGVQIIRRVYDSARNKNKLFRVGLALLFSIGLALSLPVVGAEIYFGSQGQKIGIGKPFEVGVFLNTEGENLNAIEGKIIFPIEKLEFQDIQEGASIINFWIKRPSFDGSSILFSGIVPGGYYDSQGYLFSLILKAKELGKITIDGKELRVLRNDPTGSPAQVRISPLKLEIVEESQTPEFLPPYDTEPPETFTPQITKDPNVFEGKWFLVFDTKDKGAGIDHYEIMEKKEYRIQNLGFKMGEWKIGESPYLLKDQKLKSHIYVKAIDKAGNERITELPPQNPLGWYENYLIWAIIIVGIIIVYFLGRILWRKSRNRKYFASV